MAIDEEGPVEWRRELGLVGFFLDGSYGYGNGLDTTWHDNKHRHSYPAYSETFQIELLSPRQTHLLALSFVKKCYV